MALIGRLLAQRHASRLGVRLLLAIVCASTALALIATAVQLYIDYRSDLSAIDDEFEQVERTYLDSLANSLWSFNDTQTRIQLDGLLQLQDMRYIEVRGSAGEFFAVGSKAADRRITRQFTLRYNGPGQPVLGVLSVSVGLEGIYRRLAKKAFVILLTQTTKTFLVSFLILAIVQRWVTGDLERLARYARGLSLDRLGQTLPLPSKPPGARTELDDVTVALNEMSRALAVELDQRTVIEAERARTQEALRHSEARFRDYAETASDWYWETGPDHRITYLSERLATLGMDPAARLGTHRWERAADREENPEKWRRHMATLDRHEPFREFVYQTRAEDGSLHFISVSGKPVFDYAGRFSGYRGSGRDVTDAVQAAHELREAKDKAEVASRAKSDFLANMSHELRTPLNAIIGFAEMMKSGILGTAQADRYRSYAADIHASGQHLLAIINDLLDVAQIEAGKFEFRERSLPLEEVVAQTLRMIAPQATDSHLSIVTDIERNLPPVRADERAMRQILLNLLSNAVKFTRPGGTVTVGLRREPAGGMRLSVADTGIGIAAEDISTLMRPFVQLDNVYRRSSHGTGLGLALVRSLSELHGGSVTIDSEPQCGTTVSVCLPAERVIAA